MDNPVRSLLLLRAWMLWRANDNGWAEAKNGRKRQFQEDALYLVRDIIKLQTQGGGLLGNKNADQLLHSWVPNLVAQVHRAE